MGRREFICTHCGRRVYAEAGPLAQVRLCRSCFEKARRAQGQGQPDPSKGASG
ncbi:MAG TPA: hypothetical protein VET65_10650 [Candidatus Limnocylindrales bacterium]|nr:hypothetical protein [Candidatus Limnocylindrales bacterium]